MVTAGVSFQLGPITVGLKVGMTTTTPRRVPRRSASRRLETQRNVFLKGPEMKTDSVANSPLPTVASCRADIKRIERALYGLAKLSPPERASKLSAAADLLIEARACDLNGLR